MPRDQENVTAPEGPIEPEIGRRQLFIEGARGALKLLLLSVGADILLSSTEGAAFMVAAPRFENRRACQTVAHFGNISQLVNVQTCFVGDEGDSLARGCNDYNHAWEGPAQLVATDMNAVLALAGVPRPRDSHGKELPYLQHVMLARGGATIRQIQRQASLLRQFENDQSEQIDVPLLVASAGGNNALQFLSDNLAIELLGNIVPAFLECFLPTFKDEYKSMLTALVAQREASSGDNLNIFILGVTDIGKSSGIPLLGIPGISQFATAYCRYINNTIIDVIDEIQPLTRVQLHFVNIFRSLGNESIKIGLIHPLVTQYPLIADLIKARCVGEFPDGTRTFHDEQMAHGVRPRIAH